MQKLQKVIKKVIFSFSVFSFFTVNVFGLNAFIPSKYIPTSEKFSLLQFSSEGHVLGFDVGSMYIASADHTLNIKYINGNNVKPLKDGEEVLHSTNGKINSLNKVTYQDVWDNIDIVYTASSNGIVKSTYYLKNTNQKDANENDIHLQYSDPITLDLHGNLVSTFGTGVITETSPIAWQIINGEKSVVEVSFNLISENEVGFKLGKYISGIPVIIDPTLTWVTFLGGTGSDGGTGQDPGVGMATDASGNIYISGFSSATWGSPIRAYSGGNDGFVAKLNNSGVLQWNTFLGGSGTDKIASSSITIGANGNLYIGGSSSATWGSPAQAFNGGTNGFVASLNSSGALLWNTFFGNSSASIGILSIGVDTSYNSYVTGASNATWGSPKLAYTSLDDGFVAKINSSGILQWNTFLGTSGYDYGEGIAVDSSGNTYISGLSAATWGSPIRPYGGGSYDGFVAKINTSGVLQWNTFLGGSAWDFGMAICLDSSSNIYTTGHSQATWGSPIRAYTSSGWDVFVAKLNSSGVLQWNTFLGGTGNDNGTAIDLDSSNNVYIAGYSTATWGSPSRAYSSGEDATVVGLNNSGVLQWNTFLGGTGKDDGFEVVLDSNNNLYTSGSSSATWGSPVRAYSSDYDVFVAKISAILNPTFSSITGSSTSWFNTTRTAVITAVDNSGTGIAQVRYNWGSDTMNTACTSGGTIISNGGTTAGSPVGNQTLYVCARDNAGNSSKTSQVDYKWENTVPTLSANNNSTTWYNSLRTTTISASDSGGSALAEIRYNWGSNTMNAACTTGGTTTTNGAVLNSPSGGTTLYLCARDGASNTSTWNGVYRWESTPPSFTSIIGSSLSWFNSARTSTISASDVGGSELYEVRYNWGSNSMDAACTTGGTIISNGGTTAESPSGDQTLYLCARDTAGNVTSTSDANYRWEDTPPSSPNVMTTSDEVSGDIIGSFTADVPSGSTDTGGSGLASYSLWKCDNEELTVNCVVIQSGVFGSTVTVSGEFLPSEDNTMYYYWTSIDNAGNTSNVSVVKALRMNAVLPPTYTDTPTPTPSVSPVPGGTTIHNLNSGITAVLATDWNTNLETTAQTGTPTVGVEDTINANIKVAEMPVNFGSSPDWSGVTGATAENLAYFHSTQPISTITNGAASSYTLYIRKGEGDKVLICPGATSLSEVTLTCSGGYYLSAGETKNGATALVITNGVEYWKVSGLTSTGGMSVLTGLRDTLSRLQVSEPSDHKITFGSTYGMIVGSTDSMVVSFPDFDLTGLTISDIELTDSVGSARTLAALPGVNTWGVIIDSGDKTITFSVPTSGTGGYDAPSQIAIKIGTNAGGTNQITNPSSVGNKTVSITLNNTAPGEMGSVNIPIVDSDQVNITGYVTAYIHFDIDTATGEVPGVDPIIDCNYNACQTHQNGDSGTNYTVDLGELTSAVVNKSNSTSVAHTSGGNGIINSIYFDISTNAPSGAVVTVKSANGGLQGPGTNKIPSIGISTGADGVTRSDGDDIPANSGVYGYNLPVASSALLGSIIPNSLCDSAVKYCGADTITPKTVFTTNNLPVDTARVRMDLAAAANYTNNPGLYTDTLTFIATATF